MKTTSLILSALLASAAPSALYAVDVDKAAGSQSAVGGPIHESRVSDEEAASVPLTPDELKAKAPQADDTTALLPDEASPADPATAQTENALGTTVQSEETMPNSVAGNVNPPALNVAEGKSVTGANGEVLGTISSAEPEVSTAQLTTESGETVILPQNLLSIDANGQISAKTTSKEDVMAMAATQSAGDAAIARDSISRFKPKDNPVAPASAAPVSPSDLRN